MPTLTIKTTDIKSLDFLIELLSKFAFVKEIISETKEVISLSANNTLPFRKATGKPSIDDFAGIWKDEPKTIEQIREKAWKRI